MSKRRILLLNPPAKRLTIRDYYCSFTSKANYYWPPVDLLVLSGILSEHYEIKVIDAVVDKIATEECLERIIEWKPDSIIFLTGTASWKDDFDFISNIKKRQMITSIASGGFLLHRGHEFMTRFEFLDAVLLDFTTEDILKFLENQANRVDNLIYRKDGNIISGERTISRKDFQIPIPRHELFPISKYRLPTAQRKPISTVLTTFGCPFKCRFCIGSTVGYKRRATENVIEELEHISSLGIKEVLFADFTFTADKKHVMEICNQMVGKQIDITWSCNAHSRNLDEEMLLMMKRAGCHTVQIGVESGSEEILKKYLKSTTRETVIRAFNLCKKLKIKALGYFIIGLPGEDKNSVLQTIKFAKELAPDFASFAIATPDIGTPLWEEAIEKGWFDPLIEEFDSTGYPVMETERLSKSEIWRLKNRANLEFYFRPLYLAMLLKSLRRPGDFGDLLKEGLGLLRNMLPARSNKWENSRCELSKEERVRDDKY